MAYRMVGMLAATERGRSGPSVHWRGQYVRPSLPMVFDAIVARARLRDRLCFASAATLASDTGLSERTVMIARRELLRLGLIVHAPQTLPSGLTVQSLVVRVTRGVTRLVRRTLHTTLLRSRKSDSNSVARYRSLRGAGTSRGADGERGPPVARDPRSAGEGRKANRRRRRRQPGSEFDFTTLARVTGSNIAVERAVLNGCLRRLREASGLRGVSLSNEIIRRSKKYRRYALAHGWSEATPIAPALVKHWERVVAWDCVVVVVK